MLPKIKAVATIVLLVLASVLLGELVYLVHTAHPKIVETLSSVQGAAADARQLIKFESDELTSDAYQKRVKQSFEVGRDISLTVAKFNRTVVPELSATLQALRENNLASLDALTRDLNTRLNGDLGLLPAATNLISSMTDLAGQFGVTIGELNTAIHMASEQTGKSLDALYVLISDPHIKSLLAHADEMSASGSVMAANAAAASAQLPSIAASVEKIAQTSSRFAKISLIANIISTLGRAFLP